MNIYKEDSFYFLYLKTHTKTGMRYLGYTEKNDPHSYKGSGKIWKRHIKKYGYDDVKTEILFVTYSKNQLRELGLYYSNLWSVVENKKFANLRPEDGEGGATTYGKIWITNGIEEKYISSEEEILDGWNKGRSHKCVFKNSERQKDFSKKRDAEKHSQNLKNAWYSGKFSKRDTSNIGKNQIWDVERRKKSSDAAKKRNKVECPHCKKFFQPGMAKRWHFDNCKEKDKL